MDLAIAISQGLGLAVAAGFFATAPLAVAAIGGGAGLRRRRARLRRRSADGGAACGRWPAVELAADAIWPGAEAGARLVRRVIGGGLAFELVAGDELPYVGLAVGAGVAAAVALTLRQIRIRAIRAGGDVRGTAMVEDGAGVVTSVAGAVPFVGFLLAGAAGGAVRAHAPARAGEVQGAARPALKTAEGATRGNVPPHTCPRPPLTYNQRSCPRS